MPSRQDFTGPMTRARKKAKTAATNRKPVPPSPASVNRAERCQVDRQLQALEKQYFEARRQLRIRRNFAAPFSQMPAEVLSNIFLLVQGPSTFKSSADLLEQVKPLSQVCRDWRVAALGCATLWTSPHMNCTQWNQEMLRRSRHASLRIVEPGHDSNAYRSAHGSRSLTPRARNLVACLEQHDRIRELRLPSIPSSLLKHSVSGKLSLPYPTLEVLELGFSIQVNFNKHFLGSSAPCLKVLHLHSSSISWSSPLISSKITCLTMGFGSNVSTSATESLENFFSALQIMAPSLQLLNLHGEALPNPSHSSKYHVGWSQMINLSYLRHLELTSGLYTSTTIIKQCTFPSTTTYALHVGRGDPVHPLSSLHFLFARVCAAGVTKLIASEDYTEGSLNGILQIKAWSKACPALPVESFNSSRPVLSVSYPNSHIAATESWEVIFQRLVKEMKIDPLEELRTDVTLDPNDWRSLFGRLRHLKDVTIYNNAACQFLPALQQRKYSKNKKQRKQKRAIPDFPVLRSLTIDSFEFSDWQLGQEDGSLLDSSIILLDVLEKRHQFTPCCIKSHYKIRNLTLIRCHMDYDDEQILRECGDEVDDFSWENNEFERYFDDDTDSDDEDGSLFPFWLLANSFLH
ncbi:hypothetical protein DL96DRAFT_1677620 [Flagelloscypha sp. PMI_526]|nr:hypothetical protein DL96DRAFT_1677620 [Flagelloscypha sp. PMI_526]